MRCSIFSGRNNDFQAVKPGAFPRAFDTIVRQAKALLRDVHAQHARQSKAPLYDQLDGGLGCRYWRSAFKRPERARTESISASLGEELVCVDIPIISIT